MADPWDGGDVLVGCVGSKPSDLLAQGTEQTVELPPKFLLLKIMEAMGAKQAPVFSCRQIGTVDLYQVTVHLDCSCASYSIGERVDTPKVHGDASPSELLAEYSAARNAIEYIDMTHRVRVMDYSSRLIDYTGFRDASRSMNSANSMCEELLEKWGLCVKMFADLGRKMSGWIQQQEAKGCPAQVTSLYESAHEFIEPIAKSFALKHDELTNEWKRCDEAQNKLHNEICARAEIVISKGYLQQLQLSEKDILEYTLNYVNFGPAKYVCTYTSGHLISEVKFSMPKLFGYDGKIKFQGGQRSRSARARDAAAAEALDFLRARLKVNIKDLNYPRLLAEWETEKETVRLLENYLGIIGEIEKQFEHMMENLVEACEIYATEYPNSIGVELSPGGQMAWEFCSQALVAVRSGCAKFREDAVANIGIRDDLLLRLRELKLELFP